MPRHHDRDPQSPRTTRAARMPARTSCRSYEPGLTVARLDRLVPPEDIPDEVWKRGNKHGLGVTYEAALYRVPDRGRARLELEGWPREADGSVRAWLILGAGGGDGACREARWSHKLPSERTAYGTLVRELQRLDSSVPAPPLYFALYRYGETPDRGRGNPYYWGLTTLDRAAALRIALATDEDAVAKEVWPRPWRQYEKTKKRRRNAERPREEGNAAR